MIAAKECSCCHESKPYDEFHKDVKSKTGFAYYCKVCANNKTREFHSRTMSDPGYQRRKRSSWIKTSHGITVNEYETKLKAQGSRCAICGLILLPKGSRTHLDHCHKTGKLRAFLCTNCNRGLGYFQDSPILLHNAANYLERYK